MQTGSGKVTGEGQRSRWRLGWERIGRSHTRLCIYTTTTDAQCTSGTDQWNTVTVFPQFMQKLFFPFGFFQLHKQLICSMIISFFSHFTNKNGCPVYISFCANRVFFLSLYKLIKLCGLPFSSFYMNNFTFRWTVCMTLLITRLFFNSYTHCT